MNKYLIAVCRSDELPDILTLWAHDLEDAKEKLLNQEDQDGEYNTWEEFTNAMSNIGTFYAGIVTGKQIGRASCRERVSSPV